MVILLHQLILTAFNRTIFGIEIYSKIAGTPKAYSFNRTIFGIEIFLRHQLIQEAPTFNRTIFGIEICLFLYHRYTLEHF